MIYIKEIIRKCRLCGELDAKDHTQQIESMVVVAMSLASLASCHVCKNGCTGITDVVGFTTEDAKEEK